MTALAVIPARGGSKGVWRKNMRLVAGEPLIAHAVRAVTLTSCTDVAISSDDREIIGAAYRVWMEMRPFRSKRIHSVWRPPELATDEASSESALVHAVERATFMDSVPHITVLIQCTSPLTLPEDIEGTINKLRANPEADCCFTVTRFHGFVWNGDESPRDVLHGSERTGRRRRQDLPPYFLETGAVYAMRTEAFLRTGSRFCGKPVLYEVPAERALDCDTELDIEMADYLLRRRKEKCGL